MRIRNFQLIVAVLKGKRSSFGFTHVCPGAGDGLVRYAICLAGLCTCLCSCLFLIASPAAAQSDALIARSVSATEQTARDSDRLRILREELTISEQLAATLAHRKIERLAASDPVAADEAQAQHDRVLNDITALQREINTTRLSPPRVEGHASAVPATAPPGTTSPVSLTGLQAVHTVQAAQATRATPARPWWDVYGKTARTLSVTPLSPAHPSGTAQAPTPSTSRTE